MKTIQGKKFAWLGLVGCICALTACGGGGDDDDDTGGTAATGASGSGGTMQNNAGSGGGTMSGGGTGGSTTTGGTGGKTGGTSGKGGGTGGDMGGGTGGAMSGGMVDCSKAGPAKDGECKATAKGVYALKTTLDAYWIDEQNPDTPIVDPARGNIVIYLMGSIKELCEDGSDGYAEMKACGSELPAFTSDVTCDAYQLQFDTAIWDKPTMPTFKTKGSTDGFDAGSTLELAQAIGLVGINLDKDDATWPTAAETGTFSCMGGAMMGTDCFPDQDGDGKPGITVTLKTGGEYKPDGCGQPITNNPFTYRGSPTSLDLLAGGGGGGGVRAVEVHIGLRTTLGGKGVIDAGCKGGKGAATAPETAIQSRAVSCKVDPMSLPDGDTAHPDNNCSGDEAIFVDENVPNYHILQKDAKPPAAVKDQAASPGPLAEVVRLGDLNATFDCGAVRDAFK
jgi:hypothetical protein